MCRTADISKQCTPGVLNHSRVTYAELAKYKYQLYLDGSTLSDNDEALRVAGLMIRPETPFSSWFSNEFEAWKHHVPAARDLSDLREVYSTLEASPEKAHSIYKDGQRKFRELISWPSIECYICRVFSKYNSLFAPARREMYGRGQDTCNKEPLCQKGAPPPLTELDKTRISHDEYMVARHSCSSSL